MEETAEESGDKMLLAEVYLLRYNLSEDEEYLELAQAAMTPEEYFGETDEQGFLPEILGKPYDEISWKDVGTITHTYINGDETTAIVLNEEGEIYYSLPMYHKQRGYGAFGFYGAIALEVENGSYPWGIPFYMTNLESLTVANAHMGMNFKQLDYFTNLVEVLPTGAAMTDARIVDAVKITTVVLDYNATQADANALPDTVVDLTIDGSDDIGSLDFIDGLPNLEKLSIEGTSITDFVPLHSKVGLVELALDNTNIKEVSFLEDFENLTALTLIDNDKLLNSKGVEQCTNIEKLFVEGDIEGIDGLSALTNVTVLEINYPNSLALLSGMKGLKELTIYGGGLLESFSPISGLSELEHLKISSGRASSSLYFGLEPLASLGALKTLYIQGTSIFGSGGSIFSLKNLEELYILDGSINLDGGSFSSLPNLKKLDISKATFIYNVSIWSDGPFTSIDYDALTPLEIGGKISGAPMLEELVMQDVKIEDISFAAGLPQLKTLDVSNNYITDLSPLKELENLKTVIATENPLKSGGQLEGAGVVVIK